MSTRCRRQERELCRYLDQELALEAALRFEEHARSCGSCRRHLAHHTLLEQTLLELPRPLLTAGDRGRLLVRAPPPLAPRRLRPGVALLAAAVLVLSALLATLLRDSLRGPGLLESAPVAGVTPEEVAPAASLPDTEEVTPTESDWSDAYRCATAFRRQVRDELAEMLQDLPSRAPLSSELWTELVSVARSEYQLAQACESLLRSSDGTVAENAARLLGTLAARSEALPGTVVGSLQGMLAAKSHAEAALNALVQVPGSSATRALTATARDPDLHALALLALAGRTTPDTAEVLRPALCTLAASPQPPDRALLEDMLGRLHLSPADCVPLLAEVLEAGAPRDAVATALARLGSEGATILESRAANRGPRNGSADRFLTLAGASGDSRYAGTLTERAARGSTAAFQALTTLGGPEALTALYSLASSEALSQSRRRAGRDAFWAVLASAAPESGLLPEALRRLDPGNGEALLRLCAEGPASVARPWLLDLARNRSALLDQRIAASLLFANIASEAELNGLLALLEQEWSSLDAEGSPMLCSVLVSLYRVDQLDGLRQGLDALGVALDGKHEARLTRLARAVLEERRFSSGSIPLRDMGESLRAAP